MQIYAIFLEKNSEWEHPPDQKFENAYTNDWLLIIYILQLRPKSEGKHKNIGFFKGFHQRRDATLAQPPTPERLPVRLAPPDPQPCHPHWHLSGNPDHFRTRLPSVFAHLKIWNLQFEMFHAPTRADMYHDLPSPWIGPETLLPPHCGFCQFHNPTVFPFK